MLARYESKRIFKKKYLPILIMAFLLICTNIITELRIADFNNRNITDLSFSTDLVQRNKSLFLELIKTSEGPQKIAYSQIIGNGEAAIKNRNQGNLRQAYKHEMIGRIIEINLLSSIESRVIFEDFTKEVWNDIAPEITYPDNNGNVYDIVIRSGEEPEENRKSKIIQLKYIYQCYKNNISYVGEDDANEAVFLYKIMDKIIPLFILITILFLSFDSISEEHRLKITRNVLAQPINRFSYFRKILFANIGIELLVIVISIVSITLFSGVISGFHSFKMPILTTTNQWTALRIHGMDLIKAASEPNGIGYIGPIPVVWDTLSNDMYPIVKFISFTEATLVFTLQMVLFALFVNIVTIFVSSLTNRKFIALSITVGIFAGLYGLLSFIPMVPNPMLALNVRDIISGASSFTLLSLTLIQVVSIVIMIGISAWAFNKKEIVY